MNVHMEMDYGLNFCFYSGRNSDINLVDLNHVPNTEDDRSLLLEGGLQATSPRAHNSSASAHLIRYTAHCNWFIKVTVEASFQLLWLPSLSLRFFLMDDTFLLENRLTLRAM